MKRLIAILCVLAMLATFVPSATLFASAEDMPESVDFVVLTTTDMHGKCWDKNVLTDGSESNNMLRVATAVKGYRASYGENMLVIDNGDLYQGTPVSVVQLNKISTGESDLPAAMALCLAEIGYDVSVLGNHEFNYPWATMSGIYDYLESRGVPIVTANLYYDGTDGVHAAGENVFTPYIVKTVTIGGTEHKIGVLGFENTDCTRWDIPENYPGILFAHPDNPQRSMAWEAQRYVPMMQAEGCEFIIVSYHSGTGDTSGELNFGVNTEGQVSRMIAECEGIDMVVAGHDHSSSYSNTYLKDKNGKDVLVVNGGGKDLTQSVFTFSEDGEGKLTYAIKQTRNLSLGSYTSDADLKAMLQPYADMATEYVNQTAGTAVGTWDTSSNYYLQQTDTMDLINGAQIDYGTKYMAKKYDTDEKKAALYEKTGLDHIEVDMSSTSAVTNNNYYVHPGPITMKTIVQMYKYDNNVLYLLALTGRQIKDILEQNASTRLKAIVKNGKVTFSTMGEDFTNPVFGGLNFTYDMYQPEGSRVIIEGFSNGRAFELDKTYIIACNSYHLGNTGCGFGAYSTADSVWNQNDDLAGGNVQEVLFEYISEKGEITTEPFTWSWKLDYTGNLDTPTTLRGDLAAVKTDGVEDGDQIVLYYDAEGTVVGSDPAENPNRLAAVDTTSYKDFIAFSGKAAVFTVETVEGENDPFLLKAEQGYLTAGETGNSLGFAETPTECSQWYLVPVEGGFHVMNVGAAYNGNHNQALEWYTGFTTYGVKDTGAYLFNVYRITGTGKLASELTDGRQYVIYFDQDEFCVSSEANSGGLATVKNEISGDFLLPPLAEGTLIVTANINEAGQIDFVTEDGKHLTSNLAGNGLQLTDEADANNCSLWTLVAVDGGWHVMNVGANYNGNYNQALEFYNGKFTTYGVKDTGAYLFNFYELPVTEQEEPVLYPLWIGGVQVTSRNAGDVFKDGTVRYTPPADGEPAILELNGYSYTGEGYQGSALYYQEDASLEIRLAGENSLTQVSGETKPRSAAGIYAYIGADKTLTIIGVDDGASLTATADAGDLNSIGVLSDGDLVIMGVNLDAAGGTASSNSTGIQAVGSIDIKLSHVNAGGAETNTDSNGIYSRSGSINILGSEVNAQAGKAQRSLAIHGSAAPITVESGAVRAVAAEGSTYSVGIFSDSSDIILVDSEVYAEGADCTLITGGVFAQVEVKIMGGTVEAVSGAGKICAAIGSNGASVLLEETEVTATAGDAEQSGYGVYAAGDVTIRSGSTVTAVSGAATERVSAGVAAGANLTVKGDSTVTAAAGESALSVGLYSSGSSGVVAIEDGTVTATGGASEESYGVKGAEVLVGKFVAEVTASGQTRAIGGTVKNETAGTGWADFEGAGEGETIPINEEGAELPDYKRVVFSSAEPYQVWIGGEQVTTYKLEGEGWKFTPAAGEDPAVIELNNYSYTGKGSWVLVGDQPVAAAVFYNEEAPVEVRLTGENTLTLEDREELPYNATAMFLRTEDAVILGEDGASLSASCGTAEMVSAAIAGKGNLRIEGLKLNATNTESEKYSYAVYAGKDLTIVSSELRTETGKAANGSYAIYAINGSIAIDDCKIEAISGEANFSSTIDGGGELITISNSEVTATAAEAVNSSHAIYTYKGKIEITNSTVKATADAAESRADAIYAGHSIAIADSQVEAIAGGGADYSMGLVVFTEGVTIKNSQVHAEGAPAATQSAGIYAETDVTITDNSKVELIGKDATDEESASGGILAFGTVTIEDSTVKATAGQAYESYGICGYDWIEDTDAKIVSVTNSSLYAYSAGGTYSYGIYTNTLIIGADIESVEAMGLSGAVYGTVKNAVRGKGWTTLIGSGEGTTIPVNEEGAELPEFKHVRFLKPINNPFVDVTDDAYYYDSVLWAVDHGVTTGTSATTFGPNKGCTRAQVVTFLWRAKGSPAIENAENPFTDVNESAYYYQAVLWAVREKITTGTSATTFSPDSTCTRGQIVTFLWRAEGVPEIVTKVNPFTDVAASAYYYKPVLWAVENGITKGTSATTFGPDATCTRGQVVTFLYRTTLVETERVELPADPTDADAEVFRLLNEYRAEQGLAPLEFSHELYLCAKQRTADLLIAYEENRPNGDKWYKLLDDYGVNYSKCAQLYNRYDSVVIKTPDVFVTSLADSEIGQKVMESTDYTHAAACSCVLQYTSETGATRYYSVYVIVFSN